MLSYFRIHMAAMRLVLREVYCVSVALVNVLVGDILCFDEAARW
jgi:hypothetical protein